MHAHICERTHLTPSSPKPSLDWGLCVLGGGSQGPGAPRCPTRRGHEGTAGTGSSARSSQDRFPSPSQSAPPPPPHSGPLPTSTRSGLAPRPRTDCRRPDALSKRGPCRISAKLQSGGCPEKRRRNPRLARSALTRLAR